MLAWIPHFLDRVCAVAGAFFLSQFPAFYQQYTQRLAGHLSELTRHLTALQRLAEQSGKTLPAYIQKFVSSRDLDFSEQGAFMNSLLERHLQLSNAYTHLVQANPLERPWVLMTHAQTDIMRGVLTDFQPAISLTLEGLLYATLGIMAGYLVFACLRRLVGAIITFVKKGSSDKMGVNFF